MKIYAVISTDSDYDYYRREVEAVFTARADAEAFVETWASSEEGDLEIAEWDTDVEYVGAYTAVYSSAIVDGKFVDVVDTSSLTAYGPERTEATKLRNGEDVEVHQWVDGLGKNRVSVQAWGLTEEEAKQKALAAAAELLAAQ